MRRNAGRWMVAMLALALALVATACTTALPVATSGARAPSRTSPFTTAPRTFFTIAATGDLLIHGSVAAQAAVNGRHSGTAYDFRPMLAQVKPLLSAADLAVCHVETPLSPDDSNITGYPTFNTPHELADAIRDAGYDSCSTASNHAYDQGAAGVKATLDALDAVGVAHAGTARSAAEAAKPELHTIAGMTTALLAYTYGLNGDVKLPATKPWLVKLTSAPRILADAHAARAAGARFVVVSMHWGTEYQVAPTAEQRALARTLLASDDIDLILGDHVHVVQPIERIGNKYVVYGLGNFLSNQTVRCCPAASQDGVIVQIKVEDHAGRLVADSITYWPTWVENPGYRVIPSTFALADSATPAALRPALDASLHRTIKAIGSLGLAADPAVGPAPVVLPSR